MRSKANFLRGIILLCSTTLLLSDCGSNNVKKAEDYVAAGMYEQAINLLQIEIQDNPKNPQAHCLLGTAFLITGKEAEAKSEYERAVLLNSEYRKKVAQGYFTAAMVLLDKEEKGRAGKYIRQAIDDDPELKPKIAETVLQKATQIGELKPDSPEPLDYVRLSMNLNPDLSEKIAEFCLKMAKLNFDKNTFFKARDYAIFGAECDPKYVQDFGEVLYLTAVKLFEHGNDKDAMNTMALAIQKSPNYSGSSEEFLYYLGYYFFEKEDYSTAKGYYEKVAERFPDKPLGAKAKEFLNNWAELTTRPEVSRIVAYAVDYTDGSIGCWHSQYPHPRFDDEEARCRVENVSWDGSYYFENGKLCLIIKNVYLSTPPPWHELGIGYTVTLKNATFENGATTSTFILHRFSHYGKSSVYPNPSREKIVKCYEIKRSVLK